MELCILCKKHIFNLLMSNEQDHSFLGINKENIKNILKGIGLIGVGLIGLSLIL